MFKHTYINSLACGVDVGGTHISAALTLDGQLLTDTYRRLPVAAASDAHTILDGWASLINAVIGLSPSAQSISRIGLAMPGPFDYPNGISMIRGLNKYESLYGLNIREALRQRIATKDVPISFENDAACFGLGEARSGAAKNHTKVIAITLGTGFGACFIDNQQLCTTGAGVPPNGYLYNIPFKDGIAEDYISSRWLLAAYPARDVREMAERAKTDPAAASVFAEMGRSLNAVLRPWIKRFEADVLVIGGNIARAYELFGNQLQLDVPVQIVDDAEPVAIVGAASLGIEKVAGIPARKTRQPQLPRRVTPRPAGVYDIYPFEPLGEGCIIEGYDQLADWIIQQNGTRLDGYAGIDWNLVRIHLCQALQNKGKKLLWYETKAWQRTEQEIDELVRPFLGAETAVWGTKTKLTMPDLFQQELINWTPETKNDTLCILAGAGAGLSSWQSPIIYFDLPKNEIQFRMRAGSATNLAATTTSYKRSYFVDWPILNAHRRQIAKDIAIVVDGQHEATPNWTTIDNLRRGCQTIAYNLIRPRPWFEPGVWGGQWMKQHIPALTREEINYAWSFELIAPENGLIFESDGLLLEIAFDWLMQWESKAVLGVDTDTFKEEFPIRFDFLDTFGGGNLSIQCHPSLPYIKEHFGENITQDETYYILDCKPGAGVYLGFNEDIDPPTFKAALEESQAANQAIDIEEYVQFLPAQKHDLFLIPNQTIHGSGINNLVLEISATPYIFTFKMYDWMRLDLDGMPRPINIEHAFHNLDFTRKGEKVKTELIANPKLLRSDDNHQLEILPTHPEHFYSIHRITLKSQLRIGTEGRCHLLMLVEGKKLTLKTSMGRTYILHYAETFVLPAAAGEYQLINEDHQPIKIIKAFVK